MRYYLGPWRWASDAGELYFAPPVGAVGAIDLGTLPEMAVAGGSRKGCLCWTNGDLLDSDYDLLATGDVREIKRTGKIAGTLAKSIGSVPAGDSLHEMIMDCLIGCSDPDGDTAPMPIVPGIDGWMDLWLPGHGRVKGERFEWGRTDHTDKLKRMIRKQFAGLMEDAHDGRLKDSVHHLRVLDDWCKKYGVEEWREFVPDEVQKEVPGRVPRETTYTDDFNRADAASLGSSSEGWAWASAFSTMSIVSNAGNCSSSLSYQRAQIDLSSFDHYAQVTRTAGGSFFPVARFSSSAITGYYCRPSGTTFFGLYKIISGSATKIANVDQDTNQPITVKTHCNGSTITGYKSNSVVASVTDTAIPSGTRTGVMAAASGARGDDFSAADLAASGVILTQLERGTRGISRGTWTGIGR